MVSSPTMKTRVGMEVMEPLSPELDRRAARGGADEAGVDEADEGDEQADADGDGGLELLGDCLEDRRPGAGGAEEDDQDAVDDHQAHGFGPGDFLDDRNGEEGVDAQAGGEAERQVGDETENDGHDAGGQAGDGADLRS